MIALKKHSFCCLELHERSDWRAMAPDTHYGRSLIQQHHCAYTASPYIYRVVSDVTCYGYTSSVIQSKEGFLLAINNIEFLKLIHPQQFQHSRNVSTVE